MATLIGLSLRVKLSHALPPRFKIDIKVAARGAAAVCSLLSSPPRARRAPCTQFQRSKGQ
jgi:hypothetical protein